MKRKITLWILLGCILFTTLFIFSNSFKGISASKEDSDSVIGFLEPLIHLLFGKGHQLDLHFIIRKTAHFIEFAALGFFCGTYLSLWKKPLTPYCGYGLFYLLGVGVMDEFIQSFFVRTSSVKDVLLDFCGGTFGFFAVVFFFFIINGKKGVQSNGN